LAFLPRFAAFSSLSMILEKSPKQARKLPKQVKDTHKRNNTIRLMKNQRLKNKSRKG